jgi:hypothetical protein
MRRPLTRHQLQLACDRFNATYKPGDEITVYTGLIGESPRIARIRCPAEILGGHTPVVWVEGVAGCVALTHTAPAPGGDRG